MNRRDFLKGTAAAGAAAVLPLRVLSEDKPKRKLPPFRVRNYDRDTIKKIALNKWSKHFDFSKVNEEYAPELAVMIDNQDLMNDYPFSPYKDWPNIDLQKVFDVYSQFVGKDLVSVQAMTAPYDMVIYERFKYEKSNKSIILAREQEQICAKTMVLKSPYYFDSLQIADEITREIVTDLKNNVGTKEILRLRDCVLRTHGKILNDIHVLGCLIQRKTLRGKHDWIYTSPAMAHRIIPRHFWWNCPMGIGCVSIIGCVGILNCAYKVFVDPLFPKNEILLGRRPSPVNKGWFYDAGYQYCPYIPFTRHPNPGHVKQNWEPRFDSQLVTRRGKKMRREGSAYYALLTVES